MSKTLVVGTDPEYFAGYKKDGILYALPPIFFSKYLGVETKENGTHPIFLEDSNLGIKWHQDGAAFELSISPSTDWKELFGRVQVAKELLKEKIFSKFPTECDGEVHGIPAIQFETERWKQEDADFQMCNIFGCDRDYSIFEDEDLAGKVINALKHPWRYGGGHAHFSGRESIINDPLGAIASLVFTMGLASAAFSSTPELERQRTGLYGKPGKYREQEYANRWNNIPFTEKGVEYRTPSVSWTNDIKLAEKVFEWANIGIDYLLEKNVLAKVGKKISKDARKAIVECDQPLALEVLNYIQGEI